MLAEAVRAHPELVDQWLLYSDDKRTSGGWGFNKLATQWSVDGGQPRVSDRFSTGAAGCAAFVLRELDFWSNVEELPPPLATGRFVARDFQTPERSGTLLLSGLVTEGTAAPGMTISVLVDSELYMTLPIAAVRRARVGRSKELTLLTLEPEDKQSGEFFCLLVDSGDTLILGRGTAPNPESAG
jgi:hypothetical protein